MWKGPLETTQPNPPYTTDLFIWVLNISSRRSSTTFLSKLLQCLTILTDFLLSLNSVSCGFISFHCLFSCHWALLRSIWPHLLSPLPTTQHVVPRPPSLDNPSSLSFPHVKDASVPQSRLCPFACGLASRVSTSDLYWGTQNWTQRSSCVWAVLSRGEGSSPLTCWQNCS